MAPVTLGFVALFVLTFLWLFIKYCVVEAVAACRGQTSPAIARAAAREQMTYEYGTTTVVQALHRRLVDRIENPPDRQWARELRQMIATLAADAAISARMSHEVRWRKRMRRRAQQAAWAAHTGDQARPTPPPPPPPSAADDEVETRACEGCDAGVVVPPDRLCDSCIAQPADPGPDVDPQPENDPEPNPAPDDHYGEDPGMTVTHTIAADVHNPCFALQFSTDCRNFAYAVSGQLSTVVGVMRQLRLGDARTAAANVLDDEVRGYVDETGQSIEAYARHVRIKDEIEADPDLVHTIDETYLGGGTGDHRGVTPPQDKGVPPELNAADVRTPEDCERFMVNLAAAFTTLTGNADNVIGAHVNDGVSGEPIEFLEAQRDRTARIAGKATAEADKYRAHAAKRNDTVGSDPSLAGTQNGKYMTTTGR